MNWTPAQVQRTGRFLPAPSWVALSVVLQEDHPHTAPRAQVRKSEPCASSHREPRPHRLPDGPLGSAAWAHRRRIRKGHGNSACHGPRSLLPRQSQWVGIPCVRVCVCVCVCVCMQLCTSCARMEGREAQTRTVHPG